MSKYSKKYQVDLAALNSWREREGRSFKWVAGQLGLTVKVFENKRLGTRSFNASEAINLAGLLGMRVERLFVVVPDD